MNLFSIKISSSNTNHMNAETLLLSIIVITHNFHNATYESCRWLAYNYQLNNSLYVIAVSTTDINAYHYNN